MQRKRPFYILITLLFGAVIFWGLAVSFMITEPRKITFSQDDANQISIGMTRSEVEAILGVPPGDYTTGLCDEPPGSWWTLVCDWWVSDTGEIGVWFDNEGKVRKVIFRPVQRIPEPFWNQLFRGARFP